MSRQADHTIKGFLYQFILTIKIIMQSKENEFITCEGIEDIDISDGSSIEAIQCKYHESQEVYTLGSVYKPILQMMHHFVQNPQEKVNYNLYAYFPNEKKGIKKISEHECKEILESKNQKFKTLISETKGKINIPDFLKRFKFHCINKYDDLVAETKGIVEAEGFSKSEIDNLIFPNLIYLISDLSIKKNVVERKITKRQLIIYIRTQKKLLVNKWMIELKDFNQLLKNKRILLDENLNNRLRRRAFILNNTLSENTDYLISFINDVIKKYYSSDLCKYEPLFCLDLAEDKFRDTVKKLYFNELIAWDGYIIDEFIPSRFLQSPPITTINRRVIKKEYQFKILNRRNIQVINGVIFDDYYIFASDVEGINISEARKEMINLTSFNFINYIFQLRKGYDHEQ